MVNSDLKKSEELKEKIISALREVYDPEIPVNVYDLGLIYDIDVKEDNTVFVSMTLTSPACPTAEYLRQIVEDSVKEVEGVSNAVVELTFEPLWTPKRVAVEVREELGLLDDFDFGGIDVSKNSNVVSSDKKFKKICFACGKKDNEVPIFECYSNGEKIDICIKCFKIYE